MLGDRFTLFRENQQLASFSADPEADDGWGENS